MSRYFRGRGGSYSDNSRGSNRDSYRGRGTFDTFGDRSENQGRGNYEGARYSGNRGDSQSRGNYDSSRFSGRDNFQERGSQGDSLRFTGRDRDFGGRGFGNRGGNRGYSNAPNRGSLSMPESLEHKQLVKQSLPSGSEGRPVEVMSNFFKINTSGMLVYHYSIDIKKVIWKLEDKSSGDIADFEIDTCPGKGFEMFIKKASSEIIDRYFSSNPQAFANIPFVHDGSKKIFSTAKFDLKEVPFVQTLDIGKRPTRFAIILSLVSTVNLKDLEDYYNAGGVATGRIISPSIVPVYEQVFRTVIEKKYSSHQSSFYSLDKRQRTPNKAFDFVSGFAISVRMTEFGLALNLHLKSSCLIAENISTVYQLVMSYLGRRDFNGPLTRDEVKRASKLLSGLKVQTTHTRIPRVYTIDCVSSKTTVTHTFQKDDGSITNERDYFKDTYGINVLPINLIKTMTPFRKDCPKKTIQLPMEMCFLVKDQFVAEYKLPSSVQTELLNMSTKPPQMYFPQVCNFVKLVAGIDPSLFASFGIDLTTLPVKFSARVLPLPKILNNNRDFLVPATAPANWAVICFDPAVTKDSLHSFIIKLMREAERKQMLFNNPSPVTNVDIENSVTIENCLINLKNLKHTEFVIIVLPSENSEFFEKNQVYNEVKFCENNDENIITQCVMAEKVINTPHGYFDNILDKINGKLGGTNTHVGLDYIEDLPLRLEDTMIVGIDVNHPGPIEKVAISIAAAVGTYNANFSLYSNAVRLQLKERSETITQIGEMMRVLLEQFKAHNSKRYPSNVIIFRDGVGDGHLKVIQEAEMLPIEEAIKKIDHPVKIAFVVVQKRHITRFALTNQNFMGRKPTYNVDSGTVVDTHIVEPTLDGMILNSHFSQLGTSKPSKYTILRDDFGLKTDQLERLCFFACHNCTRTRKVISIPTAIRYADLCAYRAKVLTDGFQNRNPDQITTTSSSVDSVLHQRELLAKLSEIVNFGGKTSKQLFYA